MERKKKGGGGLIVCSEKKEFSTRGFIFLLLHIMHLELSTMIFPSRQHTTKAHWHKFLLLNSSDFLSFFLQKTRSYVSKRTGTSSAPTAPIFFPSPKTKMLHIKVVGFPVPPLLLPPTTYTKFLAPPTGYYPLSYLSFLLVFALV